MTDITLPNFLVAGCGPGIGSPVPKAGRPRLGAILARMGAVDAGNLLKAIALQRREEARLGDILVAQGWVTEAALTEALALQFGAKVVDPAVERPDPRLIDEIGPDICLKHGIVPIRRLGHATLIATARPEEFAAARAVLPPSLAPYVIAVASETAVREVLIATRRTALIRRAESLVAPDKSCRTRAPLRSWTRVASIVGVAALAAIVAPGLVFGALFAWTVLTLIASTCLKILAVVGRLRLAQEASGTQLRGQPTGEAARLPVVSILVPLFQETDIASRLIRRLGRLNYPRELLDIILIAESDDARTLAALDARRLPRWMRIVAVPPGPIRTKPRALNYALNFARGQIIGVYDAEDAPHPDQVFHVVKHFQTAAPDVVCLQGILDFYNPRTNWLSRCFTLEYAAWFRIVLPGLARLGFVVPLGGTTLFFRRAGLEALGGWDAHNVTEDADLGLRLARAGMRTEMIDSVTEEEANCRALPWVRQRARWLKGYAVTWGVHMRDPARLWRELGTKKFIGVQILFLGTLSQFLLAPLLWLLWLVPFGLVHPAFPAVSHGSVLALAVLFLGTEFVGLAVSVWAVSGKRHRHLVPWALTLMVYFPLATIAAWKGIVEMLLRPFHWDKTQHGVFDAEGAAAEAEDVRCPAIVNGSGAGQQLRPA